MDDSRIAAMPRATLITTALEHRSHIDWFLTGRPMTEAPTLESAREVFGKIADFLATHHVQVLQEKIYGLRSDRETILGERKNALATRGLDLTVPVTFLEGAPADGGPFGGVQIRGVEPRNPDDRWIQTVERRGVPIGRRWNRPDCRLLVLSSLNGSAADGRLPAGAPWQAKNLFDNAAAALAEHDYTFRHVLCTWIYLARILDWYGELNRVRTAHYGRAGLSTSGSAVFPASTGIQAQSESEECLMDLLALDAAEGSRLKVRPVIRSARQDPAFSYGSAFSRAMVLESHGRKTIYISGTASIDAQGRTVHLEDPEAQCLHTLLNIAAILEEEGAGLEHLCQATVFCKTGRAFAAFSDVSRRLRLPCLPAIPVIANVCRPELLVEIEAVAIL